MTKPKKGELMEKVRKHTAEVVKDLISDGVDKVFFNTIKWKVLEKFGFKKRKMTYEEKGVKRDSVVRDLYRIFEKEGYININDVWVFYEKRKKLIHIGGGVFSKDPVGKAIFLILERIVEIINSGDVIEKEEDLRAYYTTLARYIKDAPKEFEKILLVIWSVNKEVRVDFEKLDYLKILKWLAKDIDQSSKTSEGIETVGDSMWKAKLLLLFLELQKKYLGENPEVFFTGLLRALEKVDFKNTLNKEEAKRRTSLIKSFMELVYVLLEEYPSLLNNNENFWEKTDKILARKCEELADTTVKTDSGEILQNWQKIQLIFGTDAHRYINVFLKELLSNVEYSEMVDTWLKIDPRLSIEILKRFKES